MTPERQRLMSAARRLLGSHADAEDAVQDTYVRTLATPTQGSGSQPAWLYTVLKNIAIDRLRRQRFEAENADAETASEDSPATTLEIRSECAAALRHLLGRVSVEEAAALLLRDVFEFDYEEIATPLGKSEPACRQFLHRARTRMRRAEGSKVIDDAYVQLCLRAIETRDPLPLTDLLPTTVALVPSALLGKARGARTRSKLVQVNGRYAIALILDDVVLCLVPVGTQALAA